VEAEFLDLIPAKDMHKMRLLIQDLVVVVVQVAPQQLGQCVLPEAVRSGRL
jgi:hypothetical protein